MADMTRSALPDAADKSRAVEDMFDRIAPKYDALNRVLTFRMDVRWRRITVTELGLKAPARVLDLACGTGDLCGVLEAAGHKPVGVDFSIGMLRAAQFPAPYVRADAMKLPFSAQSFDALTCGFGLRNFAELEPVVYESARVVKTGGRIAFLEVSEPTSPLVRVGHGVWFRHVVPFIGGLFSDRAAYRYLPASTAYLPALPDLFALLTAAGFGELSYRSLGLGAAQLVTGTRR
jgi:demethylmenaquinone methyltransferase/2-methoxy-6-polyprenyl-1,4-benzoquinol methylase